MAGSGDVARQAACYSRLKESAVHCRFRPGEHLKIGRLCEQLRASSTPVREALIRLHAERLVTSTVREGFFARIPNVEEFADLYQLARLLLVQTMRSSGPTGRGREKATDGLPEPSTTGETWAAAEHLTLEVARRSGSCETLRIISNINDRIRCVRIIASLDVASIRGMVTEGRRIADAIAVGDVLVATQILETMFDREIRRLPELTKELLARAHAGSFD